MVMPGISAARLFGLAAAQVNEDSERLSKDVQLFEELRGEEFSGPKWELFQYELARFALGVLLPWMGSKHIWGVLRSKRIPFRPSEEEVALLSTDVTLRTEIADSAVAAALHGFRNRAVSGTGWDPARGASLTTYFIGACVLSVVNELNKRRRSENRAHRVRMAVLREKAGRPAEDWQSSDDPCQQAINNEVLRQHMDQLPEQGDRNIVWGKAAGLTNRAIAEIYFDNEKSGKMVEQRWLWLRANVDWVGRLGNEDRK